MAYGKISTKQREILEYIKQEILNKGYPPAVREICEAVDLKSTSSVHSHLETLEKNGYIRVRSRSLMITLTSPDARLSMSRFSGMWLPVSRYSQSRTLRPTSRFRPNFSRTRRRSC